MPSQPGLGGLSLVNGLGSHTSTLTLGLASFVAQ